MNTDTQPRKASLAPDRHIEATDEVEKYQHLEKLAEMFFTSKRHRPTPAPLPAVAN